MNDRPIVGVLAASTRDHLLLDALLHITLCDRNPDGRVVCEVAAIGRHETMKVWNQSNRQCSRCAKRWEKMQRKEL